MIGLGSGGGLQTPEPQGHTAHSYKQQAQADPFRFTNSNHTPSAHTVRLTMKVKHLLFYLVEVLIKMPNTGSEFRSQTNMA